jgi:cation diffusion facilitator CzcD-associated flavoprotein CzcO
MYARRPYLPQVNKSKWTAFPGFQHGYSALDDAQRWRFYTYIFSEQVPPPYESVLRCEKHKGFGIRFSEGWLDLKEKNSIEIETSNGNHSCDAAIVCTGFDVNVLERAEIASFRDSIETWASHVSKEEAARFPEESRFPYLGDAFQLRGTKPGLERVHVFNWGSTMSHGALAGDIPGIEIGANRLAQGIARDLFAADADAHYARLLAHNEDEMKPTRFFVPPENRK